MNYKLTIYRLLNLIDEASYITPKNKRRYRAVFYINIIMKKLFKLAEN